MAGYKDKKSRKPPRGKRGQKRIDFLALSALDDDEIAREKEKARKLRKTPWWSRKKSTGRCHYCRRAFSPGDLTMDHLIPISRGGRSEKHNIVPACKECNNKKSYLIPAEWEEYLKGIKNSGENQD